MRQTEKDIQRGADGNSQRYTQRGREEDKEGGREKE